MYKMEIYLMWINEDSERTMDLYSRLFKSIEKAQNYADDYVCKRYHRSDINIDWTVYSEFSALGILAQEYDEDVIEDGWSSGDKNQHYAATLIISVYKWDEKKQKRVWH